ncbi:polyketide cyclase [Nakamurella silvestris]|nr:polyketide cyclase [Nakamurella silvestris]
MIDVDHQINAVERTVGSRALPAGEARIVTLSQEFGAAAEDVWDAVTSAERIPRWFLPVSGDLRVGGHYQLEGQAGGAIQTCDAPTAFTATWEYGGDVSWIEVTIVPVSAERARLELVHIAHVDDERWVQFGPGAVGIGWEMAVMGLALHLETGFARDPQEIAAWMVSEEARRFITESSDRWFAAHVASGESEQQARESADRTTAAYTGVPGA